MDFFEVLNTRRSVRRFKPTPIPKEKIMRLLEAATAAPSGANQQNWRFIVASGDAVKQKMLKALESRIAEIAGRMASATAKKQFINYTQYYTFFTKAPCVIAVIETPYDSISTRILERYAPDVPVQTYASIQGIAAAIENILLSATALGYGSCWMTGPLIAKDLLEKELGITPPDNLVALVPIGVPEGTTATPKRKELAKLVMFQ